MESLISLAILYAVGFETQNAFLSRLHSLFIESPENEDYFYLESCADAKDAVLHVISLLGTRKINVKLFGKTFMSDLKQQYQKSDLKSFLNKSYNAWRYLPSDIAEEEPFFTFCYAGDPLLGGEDQCKEVLMEAFNYYNN